MAQRPYGKKYEHEIKKRINEKKERKKERKNLKDWFEEDTLIDYCSFVAVFIHREKLHEGMETISDGWMQQSHFFVDVNEERVVFHALFKEDEHRHS